MIKRIGMSLLAILQAGCSVFGIRTEENPRYQVTLKEDNKEIRDYAPYIVAMTEVNGSFEESQTAAFRILAKYIFGENERNQTISMTAPVVQSANSPSGQSEKIAMTAPVVQAQTESGWIMSFMMPSKYRLEDLPRPKDPRVKFKEIPAQTVAVIRFTGAWSEEKKTGKWLSNCKIGSKRRINMKLHRHPSLLDTTLRGRSPS